MMKRAATAQVRHFLLAAIVGIASPLVSAQAQESAEAESDNDRSIDEIVVVVDRDGNRVNVNMRRLEEARLKVIREFRIDQHTEEEELWRMRLRSTLQRKTSRIAWGYDAQAEAARFRYSQANYLPIDRVKPATVFSVRF